MTDIYSAENIARSRARADAIREQVRNGEFDPLDNEAWLQVADEVDAYAAEREATARAREALSVHLVRIDAGQPEGMGRCRTHGMREHYRRVSCVEFVTRAK